MAVDPINVVELQTFLQDVRASLQTTMTTVERKISEMAGLTKDANADVEKKISEMEGMPQAAKAVIAEPHLPALPGAPELGNQEIALPCDRAQDLPLEKASPPSEKELGAVGIVPPVPPTPSTGATRSTVRSEHMDPDSKKPREPRDSNRWTRDALLRCIGYHRRRGLPKRHVFTLKDVEPTHFFQYTCDENFAQSIGKKLKQLRKVKLVPARLWEPRVVIIDDSNITHSLKDIEDHKDCCHMTFPVRVSWHWLTREEFPQVGWRDRVWWKVMGFFANNHLREFAMRCHARVRVIDIKVKRLAEGHHEDEEKCLANLTNMAQETEDVEIEMALDALRDIDDLLRIDFLCDGRNYTLGEVTEAAGCSWGAFLEAYMKNRNNALSTPAAKVGERRRDLLGAAVKGSDGLELLFQQLVHRIDGNDLMVFKFLVLFMNGLIAIAQFFWSDYVVPRIKTPDWQQDIADMKAKVSR